MIAKVKHKAFLFVLKIIPMVLALIYFFSIIQTVYTDGTKINVVGHVPIIQLSVLYLESSVFQFCFYHRMFLHYISVINIYNAINVYYPFRILTLNFFITIMIITFIFMVILLINHLRKQKGGGIWR